MGTDVTRPGHERSVNGRVLMRPWSRLRRLVVAGIDTPMTWPARSLRGAMRAARQIGYPLVLKGDDGTPLLIGCEAALRRAWRDAPGLLQEYLWTGAHSYRVTVVGDRARHARLLVAVDGFLAREGFAHEHRIGLTPLLASAAEAACKALGSRLAVVNLIPMGSGCVVLDVETRAPRLPDAAVDALAEEVVRTSPPRSTRRPRLPRSFQVAITCPDPRALHPVWLWCCMPADFRAEGCTLVEARGPAEEAKLADSDFILIDPARTRRQSGDDWLNHLWERYRDRSHYAKRVVDGRLLSVTTKAACAEMVLELKLPHPPTFTGLLPAHHGLPLVLKPSAGSCGRGIRLLRTPEEVRAATPEGRVPTRYILQEWVSGPLPHPVSFRVITVRERVIASAIFWRPQGTTSNLGRGGRAIAFSGRHQRSRLSTQDRRVLDALGIEGSVRELPSSVADAARRAARWLSSRGVQLAGHDFIPDGNGGWLYLESNAYPGYLLFAATDGDRRRRLLSGYFRAGRLFARAIASEFAARDELTG